MTTRFLMLGIILMVSCSLAADDSFKSFRIPDHTVFASGIKASGSYDWDNSGYKHGDQRERYVRGSLAGSLYWLRDSDSFRSIWQLGAGLSGERDSEHFDNSEDGSTGEYVSSRSDRSVSSDWEGWFYPSAIPIGIYGSMSGGISSSENMNTGTGTWSSGNTAYAEIEDRLNNTVTRTASINAGIVWGRVRNATTVYKVRILEQRLQEIGVLSGKLQSASLQKLAELFHQKDFYEHSYERPDRYYWRDVEALLTADPAFDRQAFNLYAFHRMIEEINGQKWTVRNSGYSIGPIVSGSHYYDKYEYSTKSFTHYESPDSAGASINSNNNSEHKSFRDYCQIGIKADYYLPLNLKWQINLTSSITRKIQPENKGYTTTLKLHAIYEIADRWAAEGYLNHSRSFSDPLDGDSDTNYPYYQNSSSSWSVRTNAEIKYYIESQTALSLSVSYYHSEFAEPDENVHDRYSNGMYVSIGAAYHFTGFIPSYSDLFYY